MKDIIKIAEVCVEKNKSHCLDCSKSAEKDMLLTCRSLMKELLMYINKLTIDNEKLKSLNNSISLGADLHSESYKQEISDLEKERDKYKDLYETMYKKYAKLEAESYTKEDYFKQLNNYKILENRYNNLVDELRLCKDANITIKENFVKLHKADVQTCGYLNTGYANKENKND